MKIKEFFFDKKKNAQLRSTVFLQGENKEKLFDLPIGVNEEGGYEISWVESTDKVLSGDYVIELFREVDTRLDSKNANPLVSITIPYQAPPKSLPFKIEFFIVVLLLVAFFAANVQKQKYNTH